MQKILFQGDSITDAGRNRENPAAVNGMGCGYPLLLKARLYCDCPGEYECVNLGIGGHRIVDIYARMKRDIINIQPDVLSFLIGVNDVWHDLADSPNGVDAAKFERVYDWLLTELREALPKLQLILMEPFVLPGPATKTEENAERWATFEREVPLRAQAAKRMAEKHGAKFVPLQEKLNEACRFAPAEYWLRDGVHPTEAGHELIAREWMKVFKEC